MPHRRFPIPPARFQRQRAVVRVRSRVAGRFARRSVNQWGYGALQRDNEALRASQRIDLLPEASITQAEEPIVQGVAWIPITPSRNHERLDAIFGSRHGIGNLNRGSGGVGGILWE